MTAGEIPLSVQNLTFRYWRREEPAIQSVSFDLTPGQVMLIAGASGCGKTTLMRCINGLIPHTYRGEMSGEIHLFGTLSSLEMGQISQSVGTVLQDPERQILGSYVLNEVAFGLESLGMPREEITPRVEKALERLGILDLRDRETFGISGGEKQKVALAGVLAMEPRVLLLDEPLASLDPASAHEALVAFRQLADEGMSLMIVEHRVEDVLSIDPDALLYMDEGRVVYSGGVAGLLDAVDYRRIKLPAPAVLKRARHDDPPPPFEPLVKPPEGEAETLVRFEDVHFQYGANAPEVLKGVHFGSTVETSWHPGAQRLGQDHPRQACHGTAQPSRGRVLLGRDTRQSSVAQNARTVGYVFQSPSQMLLSPTVREGLGSAPAT
jgi:energy-coupling factor transport system ATP-binding protein